MYFDGQNGKRNFIIAVVGGFAVVSILVFGVIAFIANVVSPKPTPNERNVQQAAEQRPQSNSTGSNTQNNPSTSSTPESPNEANNIPATTITIGSETTEIIVGEKTNLNATITPTTSTDTVVWTSSNDDIATVDQNGVVTGIKEGAAVIYAEANNNVRASMTITVRGRVAQQPQAQQTKPQQTQPSQPAPTQPAPAQPAQPQPTKPSIVNATGIKVSPTNVSIDIGETYNLNATILPNNTTNKTITWSSSNTSIATVTNGKVTGKSAGTAVITAKTHNGKAAAATIKVVSKAPSVIEVTGVKVSPTSATVAVGATVTFSASVIPSNATNQKITWSSSNTNIATVSNGVVTGKKVGTVTIKARSINGNEVAATLTVVPAR